MGCQKVSTRGSLTWPDVRELILCRRVRIVKRLWNHLPRCPLPLPLLPPLSPLLLEPLFGPSISNMSFLLSFNVPFVNLPIPGAPTPLSLFLSLGFLPSLAFSRMMPFSLASFRLMSSFWVCFAIIPRRCAIGIFSCFSIDTLDPKACSRRSVALWRLLPLNVGLAAESRRWDSVRRRWRARSFFRLAASEASSSSIAAPISSRTVSIAGELDRGFELCR